MIKDDFLTLTAQKFINTYFTSRNFDQVKNMFAPEGSWLGASNNTMANNLKHLINTLKRGVTRVMFLKLPFKIVMLSTTTIILESFIVIIIYISKAKEPFLIWING